MKNILAVTIHPPALGAGGEKLLFQRYKLLGKFFRIDILTKYKKDSNQSIKEQSYFNRIYNISINSKNNKMEKLASNIKFQIYLAYILMRKQYDIVHIDFFKTLLFIILTRPLISSKIVFTVVDIYYLAMKDRIQFKNKLNVINLFKLKIITYFEIFLYKHLVHKIAVWGEDDKNELISKGIDESKIHIIPPIIDTSPIRKNGESNTFVFLGSGYHPPNVDSINLLYNEYWPFFKEEFPRAKLLIIGEGYNVKIDNPNIEYLGFIKNINVILKNSRAVIAPIAWGAGIKVKIIECICKGIPLLTNNDGFRNIDNFKIKKQLLLTKSNIKLFKSTNYLKEISHKEILFSSSFSPKNVLNKYYSIYE